MVASAPDEGPDVPRPGAEDAAFEGLVSEALFRPVRNGNAFEDTVARLLQTIRLGLVQPGEALPSERELAIRFSVSRDTVRDAIRSLAEAGYLQSKRGRYGGTFVNDTIPATLQDGAPNSTIAAPFLAAEFTAAEIDDVLGLREILEVGSARAAAGRSLAAAERDLLYRRMKETAAASIADYRRLDSRLHLTIGELVGTPSLVSLLADNRTAVNGLLDHIPLIARNIEHSNEQHEAIVVAILTGDAQRAADAMLEHLAGSAALLRGFLA